MGIQATLFTNSSTSKLYQFPGFIISIYSFASEQMKEFTCKKHYRWQEYDENAGSHFAKGTQSRT